MAENRSLADALTLTPEKLSFIKGEGAQAPASLVSPEPRRRGRKPKEKTINVELSSDTGSSNTGLPDDTFRSRRPRPRHDASSNLPNANEVLNEVLVPLTTRIPHRLIQSLRRVCLERRLQHLKPDSIQEIVEEAIGEWLSRQA